MKLGFPHEIVSAFLCCHITVTACSIDQEKQIHEIFRVHRHVMMTLWQVYTNTRWQYVTACWKSDVSTSLVIRCFSYLVIWLISLISVVFASSSSLSWSIRKLLLYLINNNGTAGILYIINNTVFIAEVAVLCLFLQSKAVASLSRVIVVHLQMLHICRLGFSPLLSLRVSLLLSNVFKHSLQLL